MENFQEALIRKLQGVGFSVKYLKFIFKDETFTRSDISADHLIIPEKLGITTEYLKEIKGKTIGQRMAIWEAVHRHFMDLKKGVKGETTDHEFTLLIDRSKGKDNCKVLYNSKTGKVGTTNWHAFSAKFGKSTSDLASANPPLCDFIFDPNAPKRVIDPETEDWTFNLYDSPLWEDSDIKPEVSPFIQTLLDHLFTSEVSREYALKWLYVAMTDRCPTYLVLNSYPGVGKGVFEAIARALIGWDNSDEPSSGFLADKFNSIMANKKLLILDEIKVTEKSRDKLKRYVNSKISIEGKGVDARTATANFCSFIISNNELTDVHLKWNDRRFAVMDLTKARFNSIITDKITNGKVAEFEHPENEEIAAFGKWLMEKFEGEDVSVYPVPPSKHFYNLVEVSLHEWQKLIVEEFELGGDSITFKKLRRKSKALGLKFPANIAKIATFLRTYKHGLRELVIGHYDESDEPSIKFIREENLGGLI